MKGWGEIIRRERPTPGLTIGPELDRFLAEVIGSFAGWKALLYLIEHAPEAKRLSAIRKAIKEEEERFLPTLEALVKQEVLETESSLLGNRWRYREPNSHHEMIQQLQILWQHPRTRSILLQKLMELEGRLS